MKILLNGLRQGFFAPSARRSRLAGAVLAVLAAASALSACAPRFSAGGAAGYASPPSYQLPYPPAPPPAAPPPAPPGAWRLRCAPFARELTGIALFSEAGDWWDEAAGRYRRAPVPGPGAVLVFPRSERLARGHVGVVSAVLDPRRILIITVDWLPGELGIDQEVVDVSPYNDWTAVRVWYPPLGGLGATVYPTYGFIVPPAPRDHDSLVRQATQAVGRG